MYILLILLADPFDFFALPVTISPPNVRLNYAAPADPVLYRFVHFQRHPKPDVLLGDSRMALLKEELLKQRAGLDIANVAVPGGTLESTIDSFWLAAESTKLRSVVMGISFDTYSDYGISKEIATFRAMASNRMLYFTNRNVLNATVEAYRQRLGFRPSERYSLNGISKEAIWNTSILNLNNAFHKWRRPVVFLGRLREIAEYCRKNNIEFRFVIFPQHDILLELIRDHGLMGEFEAMKVDLAKLAPVIDFSQPTAESADKRNFTDSVHFIDERRFGIIARLWPPQSSAHP